MEFQGENYQIMIDSDGPHILVHGHRYDIGSDLQVVTGGEHPLQTDPELLAVMDDNGNVIPTDHHGYPIQRVEPNSPIFVDAEGPFIGYRTEDGGIVRLDIGRNAADPRYGPDAGPTLIKEPAILYRLDPTGHPMPTDAQGNLLPLDLTGLGTDNAPLTLGEVGAGGPEPTGGGPTDFGSGANLGSIFHDPGAVAPPLHIGGDFTSSEPAAAGPTGTDLGALLGFNTGDPAAPDPGAIDPPSVLLGTPPDDGHAGPVDAGGALPPDIHSGFGSTDQGPLPQGDPGAGAFPGSDSGGTVDNPSTMSVDPSPVTHVDAPPPPPDPTNQAPFTC